MQHLNQLLERLIKAEVEFVLVGGLAAAIHGSSLNTRDVDVCCRFTEGNLKRIQAAFHDLHPVHRARPDIALNVTPELCAGLRNLYLKTDIGIVDCLGEVLAIGGYDEVLGHSIILSTPNLKDLTVGTGRGLTQHHVHLSDLAALRAGGRVAS